MATPSLSPAYGAVLDFIMAHATPEDILAFKMPESEQERIIELLDKQDDDTLTPEEASELQQIVVIDKMFLALKARALGAKV